MPKWTRWLVRAAPLMVWTWATLVPLALWAQNNAGGAEPASGPGGLGAVLALEKTIVDAIARAERSVVAIARERRTVTRGDDAADLERLGNTGVRTPDDPDFVPQEYGTGVIVDRAGLIVTNYHVLGDPRQNRYWVWVNRRPFLAEVKAADPWLDLAVLKISAEQLEPITLADAKEVRKGQFVVSLGNPYAIARDGQPSATWGIVANLSRKAPAPGRSREPNAGSGETLHQYGTLIQTDCRLQRGTSGGALVNLRGEMIGLTTALAALEGDDAAAGFAIPVDETFRRALETLKAGRKADYGFLGVAPELLGLNQRQQGEGGVLVRQIVEGTPAARSGLTEGDRITHVAGTAVVDPADLIRELSKLPADARVQLTVARRDGKTNRISTVPVSVQLSKKFLGGPLPPYAQEPDPTWRGLRVDYATAAPQFADRRRDVDPAGCVAIVEVRPESPAWRAGLRAGNFVSFVDKKRVTRPAEFFAAIADRSDSVTLRVSGVAEREANKVVPAE